jgi:hypothetical protein
MGYAVSRGFVSGGHGLVHRGPSTWPRFSASTPRVPVAAAMVSRLGARGYEIAWNHSGVADAVRRHGPGAGRGLHFPPLERCSDAGTSSADYSDTPRARLRIALDRTASGVAEPARRRDGGSAALVFRNRRPHRCAMYRPSTGTTAPAAATSSINYVGGTAPPRLDRIRRPRTRTTWHRRNILLRGALHLGCPRRSVRGRDDPLRSYFAMACWETESPSRCEAWPDLSPLPGPRAASGCSPELGAVRVAGPRLFASGLPIATRGIPRRISG